MKVTALLILPVAALFLVGAFFYVASQRDAALLSVYTTVLVVVSAGVSVPAIVLALWGAGESAVRRRLAERADEFDERDRYYRRRLAALTGQVELLSAIRELSLVSTDPRRTDQLTRRIIELICGLLPVSAAAIFVAPAREGDAPVGALQFEAGQWTSDEDEIGRAWDMGAVCAAFLGRTARRFASGGERGYAYPLVADDEIVGVIAARLEKSAAGGKAADGEDAAPPSGRRLLRELKDFSGHIARAIRTTYLARRATTDPTTGLLNRDALVREIDRLFAFAKEHRQRFSVIMADLDRFKAVNDTHGHLVGDRVLARSVIERIRSATTTASSQPARGSSTTNSSPP